MPLTKKEVEKLASLARIKLTKEEKEKFGKQISSILDYAEQVKEVDTSRVKSASHLPRRNDAFRNDQKTESDKVKEIIKQFPDKSGNLNKVKAVLD